MKITTIQKKIDEYKKAAAEATNEDVFEQDRCVQSVRPVSNIIESIFSFVQKADSETFQFIFGMGYGDFFYQDFNKKRDFFSFYKSLNILNKVRLTNYIEGNAISYDVINMVEEVDLQKMLGMKKVNQQPYIRDLNHAKYAGQIDEDAVLRWVSNNKK